MQNKETRHKQITSDKIAPINEKVRSANDLKIGMRLKNPIMAKDGIRPLVKSGECLTKLHVDQLQIWNNRSNKKNARGQVDRANPGGYAVDGVAVGDRERPEIIANPLLSRSFEGINTNTFSVGVAYNRQKEVFYIPKDWIAGIDFSFDEDGNVHTPHGGILTEKEFHVKYPPVNFIPPIPPSTDVLNSETTKVQQDNDNAELLRNKGQARVIKCRV